MPVISNGQQMAAVRAVMNDSGMRKSSFTTTRAPAATDNGALGYEVGSRWINLATGGKWTLTGFSGGNATWTPDSAGGSVAIGDVSGLQAALDGKAPASAGWTLEQIQDAVAAMFQAGTHTNATITYDDAAGTLSLTASGGGGGGGGDLTQEQVEDMVGNLVVQGSGISVNYDDANNVLTISLTGESYTTAEKNKLAAIAAGATANATDAQLRDRSTHTGAQAISTVTGLQAALDGKAASGHAHAIADVTGLQAALDGKASSSAALTAVAHGDTLTGTGAAGSPLDVVFTATPTVGSIVAYAAGGVLKSNTPSANDDVATKGYVDTQIAGVSGGGASDPGDIANFGGAMSVWPALAAPSQAICEANAAALTAALAWSATTGGLVRLGIGILYIWGAVTLPLGASIEGQHTYGSRIQQANLPTNDTQPWLDVLTAPAISGNTGGNGYNRIANLTLDGGWTRENYAGAGYIWTYDDARMTAAGLRIATPANGTGGAAVFRAAGSDAHCSMENVYIQNVAGYGFHMSGRGENFLDGIEIRLCHRGYYLSAPDCFFDRMTIYTCGDVGAEIKSGAGNFRWTNSKLWFIGQKKGSEPIGAGIYLPDAGGANFEIIGVDTQDTWGPGLYASGAYGLKYIGQIDHAGGGRLENQALGWAGARTLTRTAIRIGSTCVRADIDAVITGGNMNGSGNYPFLVDFSASGAQFNTIKLNGRLDYINMASGSGSGGTWANGVRVANGLTNAKQYNQVWFWSRLMYGYVTQTNLDDAAHALNTSIYSPTQVIRDDGRLMVKSAAGAWVPQGSTGGATAWGDVTGKPNVVIGDGINAMRRMTQAAYDALTPKDSDTFYVIVG